MRSHLPHSGLIVAIVLMTTMAAPAMVCQGGSASGRGTFSDLAIVPGQVSYPDSIFRGEGFGLSFAIKNQGDLDSTPFNISITNVTTGKMVKDWTTTLGVNSTTTFMVDLNLLDTTVLSIDIDPSLNNDTDLANNHLEMTLTPRLRPDFFVSAQNISFSPIRPDTGETVDITVDVSNLGGPEAWVDVVVLDGINGTGIGIERIFSDTITTTTNIEWTPTKPGIHNIAVVLQNSTPSEAGSTQGDNHANRTILVGSHTVPSVHIDSPTEGSNVTMGEVNISGRATDHDGDALEISLRVDGGPWESPVVMGPDGDHTWFMNWNFSYYPVGHHEITARAKDDIHENLTTVTIKLVEPPPPLLITDWSPKEDPTVLEGDNITFVLLVSTNIDCVANFTWYIDGIDFVQGPGANVMAMDFGYSDQGRYSVVAKAVCGRFNVSKAWNLTVLDDNRPPEITIAVPYPTVSILEGETMDFSVMAIDPDEGTSEYLNYTWTGPGVNRSIDRAYIAIYFPSVGNFTVKLNITDDKGGYVVYTWTVEVKERPGPPDGRTRDDPWWMLIVFVGVLLLIMMVFIYVKFLQYERTTIPIDEDEDPLRKEPPTGKVS